MPYVITLSGSAGSGKDTVVKLLRQLRPDLKIENYAFANRMKDAICFILRLDRNLFDDPSKKELPIEGQNNDEMNMPHTPRTLMQQFSDRVRPMQPTMWIDWLGQDIEGSKADVAVVTDARFQNELYYCAARGWPSFRVLRPRLETTTIHTGHATEQEWRTWNYNEILINPAGPEAVESDLETFKTEVEERLASHIDEALDRDTPQSGTYEDRRRAVFNGGGYGLPSFQEFNLERFNPNAGLVGIGSGPFSTWTK